ncbi:MAG: RuBisCO large subunit C-terminal-like domain-containing protein, partial [Candidatus Methanomethylophilaceae archaeon]|nr:RuBisCO large subunit C-terminal-like domain-containing protein [Candidatus Methanomethylophilaceae archaeon]
MSGFSYMHLGEEADPATDVVCKYRVKTDMPIEKAAEAIAAEQSTGTWTDISTLTENTLKNYGARVLAIEGDLVTIAFPDVDFSIEVGGIPQILSVVSGNLYGLEALKAVRFEDIQFPRSITSMYKGPRFGADGLRKILGRPEKPLIGTIVKPKIGLSPKETAGYVYEAGAGGLTNSKDDETLVDQKFCPMQDRTVAVAESLDRLA